MTNHINLVRACHENIYSRLKFFDILSDSFCGNWEKHDKYTSTGLQKTERQFISFIHRSPGTLNKILLCILKPDMLDDKDNVAIDNSHEEEVMVMKMARKIEGLTGIFGLIQLVVDNQNVRFTNKFLTKVNVTAI